MARSTDSSNLQKLSMRWCIFVDILGFSQLWEAEQLKALHSLRELMKAIHRIGTRVYPDEEERLFVHHMGDGFAIVSDFGEASFERPLSHCIGPHAAHGIDRHFRGGIDSGG